MKRASKLLALMLMLCFAVSMLTGFVPANVAADNVITGNELFELPDIIDAAEAKEKNYIGRLKSEEKDLYTFVFANADGTNTMRIFSHPVKYVADDGSVRDISLGIEAKRDGGFVTSDHEIITTFGSKLTEGITLEYDDTEIMLVPSLGLGTVPKAELDRDGKVITYKVNDNTSFVYELTYSGFKEDIVVQQYTGQTEYTFTLRTNGLTLCEEDGSYYLTDSDGNIEAVIGDIIVFTADERNNTMGSMTYKTVRANQEYVLTIHLDAEYLADKNTKYPIRIDPTIEINYSGNGAGAIEDVTLNSTATSSATSTSLTIGLRNNYGIGRVLMRFPGLDMDDLPGSSLITAASVEIRDLICNAEEVPVSCYVFDGNDWTESTASWDSVAPYSLETCLSSHSISYYYGIEQPTAHRYAFNILEAVRGWKNGGFDPDKGILFKASDEIENGTTAKYLTIASYNRSNYKPSLSITYCTEVIQSLYYSEYDPSKFDSIEDGPSPYSYSYSINFRMNCYGYALGFILNQAAYINYDVYAGIYGYLQAPGEFAAEDDKENTFSLSIWYDPTTLMDNVVSNMMLDAARLEYTITEHIPTSSTVAQFGTNSRLIAVVTGDHDFHFYMQHNDGTWSHKPGSRPASNRSLSSNVVLTNSNIRTLANEGIYAGGELKFFIITKSTVLIPHSKRCCDNIVNEQSCGWCSEGEIPLSTPSDAGGYLQTSTTIFTGDTSAKIDFAEDHDVYCFTPSVTRTYTISTSCISGANLDCVMYNNSGMTVQSDCSAGQPSISIQLVAGNTYYFDIYNSSKTVVYYTFTIS